MRKKPHVAIFFGGDSNNRDLSQETAYWIAQYAPRFKFRVTPVHITTDGMWQVPMGSLPERGSVRPVLSRMFETIPALTPAQGLERLMKQPIDMIMTVLRGPGGDDGAMHGLGTILSLPVIGSSLKVCQQTSDKYMCGESVSDVISTPESYRFSANGADDIESLNDRIRSSFVPPFFVKSIHQEGSNGVIEVNGFDDLAPAVRRSLEDDDVIIQKRNPGREVSVTLFNTDRGELKVLPPTVVAPKNASYYDHMAKRRAGRVDLITSRASRNPLLDEVETIARDVYEELGCNGLVSMDMMLGDESTELLEVNTIPTLTSLTPLVHQLKAGGVHPTVLLTGLFDQTLNGN